MLAPAPPDAPAQVIDARDLAAWIVRSAETGLTGTFDAVGRQATRAELIEACRRAAGADAELVWVNAAFLADQGVGEWMELPLWLHDPAYAGMLSVDPSGAFAAGLRTRPLEETARDTLAWAAGAAAPAGEAGLDREKEGRLLAAWDARPRRP